MSTASGQSDSYSGSPPGETADTGSVGAWLKAAREGRGESLDAVASATRIGKGYLEAIEAGASSKLPGRAYTRGFVRLYASHLGLSPDEALAMLDGNLAVNHGAGIFPPDEAPTEQTQPSARSFLIRCLPPAALLIFAAILLFYFLTPHDKGRTAADLQNRSATTPPAPESSVKPAPAAPDRTRIDPPPTSRTEPTAAAPAEGLVLRLKAVADSKVHITIDGSTSQEYDLATGDLVEWKADRSFQLDLENAGALEGELDGKPMLPFGDNGKAAHLIITPDGVRND